MGFPGRPPEQCALAFVPLFSFYSVYEKKMVLLACVPGFVIRNDKNGGYCYCPRNTNLSLINEQSTALNLVPIQMMID